MTNPTSMTLEEIEAQVNKPAETAPPKPEEVKFPDAETLPEHLRGRSAAEIIKYVSGIEQSFKASEAARKAAESALSSAGSAREAAASAASQPKLQETPAFTREQMEELLKEKPLEALEMILTNHTKIINEAYERRFQSLAAGTASSAEANARRRYELEFEILGDEIRKTAERIPDKAALGTDNGWNELIAFVRGLPGNYEKLNEARYGSGNGTAAKRDASAARQAEREDVGFTGAGAARSPAPTRKGQPLDQFEREVADKLGMTEADYVKWRDIGG